MSGFELLGYVGAAVNIVTCSMRALPPFRQPESGKREPAPACRPARTGRLGGALRSRALSTCAAH
jgi:hypothetical protein